MWKQRAAWVAVAGIALTFVAAPTLAQQRADVQIKKAHNHSSVHGVRKAVELHLKIAPRTPKAGYANCTLGHTVGMADGKPALLEFSVSD